MGQKWPKLRNCKVGYKWIMYDYLVWQLRSASLLKPLLNGGRSDGQADALSTGLWLWFSLAPGLSCPLGCVLPGELARGAGGTRRGTWGRCAEPAAGRSAREDPDGLRSPHGGRPGVGRLRLVTVAVSPAFFLFFSFKNLLAFFVLSRPSDNPLRMRC